MPQSTGQGEEVRGQGRFDPIFFDPRPRRRRDSNDNHERDNERRQNRQRVKSKRCRKCGLRESDNNKFKEWHERRNRSDNLCNTAENQVHKFCTTPPNERKPGYPLEEHEQLPPEV